MRRAQSADLFFENLNSISVNADAIQIIDNARDFRRRLLALIKNARRRIYITALYLQDDESGREILEALYQAKQNNPELEVKLFVDFLRAQRGLMGQAKCIGNVRLYRELAEKYEHSIDILGVPVKSKEVLGVLHLKGFVFDDTLLYSGASINNIYLQENTRYRYDRYHVIDNKSICDTLVDFCRRCLLESSAVRSLTEENIPDKKKLKHPIKQFKKSLRLDDYRFTADKQRVPHKQVSVTPMLGFGGRRNLLNDSIIQLLKKTENHATIFTPYFNLPNKVNKGVKRLLKKGKTVNIVVGDKTANDFYIPIDETFTKIGIVPYVYETNLRKFLKRNQKFVNSQLLNVYLWSHADNSYHLKGISVDEQMHLITGHNINPRAWLLDLENGLLIRDPDQLLASQFRHEYQTILTHARRIEHFEKIETLSDYPEAVQKLMRKVKRAKLDSILNRLL